MSNLSFIQDTLEKYGLSDRFDAAETLLYLDSWRRLGPNQKGKPCGRGWVGLRGACKRGKKSDDNAAKIKESKIELADKIRAKKGLRDRNAPKPVVEEPKVVKSTRTKAKVSKTKAEATPEQQSPLEKFDKMSGDEFRAFIRSNPDDKGLADYQKIRKQFGDKYDKASEVANQETRMRHGVDVGIYLPSREAKKTQFKMEKLWTTIVENGITQAEKGPFIRELPKYKGDLVSIAQKLGIETKGKRLSKIVESIADKAVRK